MKWFAQKEAFYKTAIAEGARTTADLREAFPLGWSVPEARVMKWLRGLNAVPTEFSTQRRYLNRFKVGADPEFVVLEPAERRRIDAHQGLGLKQGLAFGADNNGRLVEVRPYPSRSTLEVTASILETLRHMAVHTGNPYMWVCGAYIQEDGVGGHVHFGRKRPGRNAEVAALDALEHTMVKAQLYPTNEIVQRRRGDARHQIYGMPGDFRLQVHGYEYRTFPSWLDSPELAFLTMTLAKLAVQKPELMQWRVGPDKRTASYRLKNLLAYYKDADDDARLAYVMLDREGEISHRGGDFRARWGIPVDAMTQQRITVLPQAIRPSPETTAQLWTTFANGKKLGWTNPITTWSPSTLPKGYRALINDADTHGQKGFGEMIWDLCSYSGMVELVGLMGRGGDYDGWLVTSKDVYKQLPPKWRFENKVISSGAWSGWVVGITSRGMAWPAKIKEILLDGTMPIWKISEVMEGSFEEWKAAHDKKPKPVEKRFRGVVVDRYPEGQKIFAVE